MGIGPAHLLTISGETALEQRLAGSVDIGTVIDVDDSDREVGRVDFVDNSVGAHSRRVHSKELASKWFTDTVGVGKEGTDKEIQDRDGDLVG